MISATITADRSTRAPLSLSRMSQSSLPNTPSHHLCPMGTGHLSPRNKGQTTTRLTPGSCRPSYDGKPTVLFLCVHNAGRSQMALGFFQHYAGDNAIGWSGGSEPGDQVSPVAIEVMAERGIRRIPQTVDRRGRPSGRCRHHDGLWRRLPGVPRQTLRGMDPLRPGGVEPGGSPADPRRDRERWSSTYSSSSRSRLRRGHRAAPDATVPPQAKDGRFVLA